MDINKVIQLGAEIQKQDIGMFESFTLTSVIWMVLLFALGVFIAKMGGGTVGAILISVSVCIFIYNAFALPSYNEDENYKAEIVKWKKEVAYPFINSIEKEQKEVVYVKIDPEMTNKVSGFMFGIQSSTVEKTPIVVSYKDNGVVTRTDWVPTHMELTAEDKPYIEFQRLTKDLGHGIKAGLYNPQVYLPESYSFTEIK